MERLARAYFKAVSNELLVTVRCFAAQYLVASVSFVAEYGVPDMSHVSTDLVCASCFKTAFEKGYVSEAFDYAVVGNGGFSYSRAGRKDTHLQAVFGIACYVSLYCAFLFGEVAPYERLVSPSCGFVEELQAQACFCFRCLCYYEQP